MKAYMSLMPTDGHWPRACRWCIAMQPQGRESRDQAALALAEAERILAEVEGKAHQRHIRRRDLAGLELLNGIEDTREILAEALTAALAEWPEVKP